MVLDLFSISIITALIANGCTMLMTYGLKGIIEITNHKKAIRKALEADTALVINIRQVMK